MLTSCTASIKIIFMFCRNEDFLASGSENGDLFVWSLLTYKLVYKLKGKLSKVDDNLTFSLLNRLYSQL